MAVQSGKRDIFRGTDSADGSIKITVIRIDAEPGNKRLAYIDVGAKSELEIPVRMGCRKRKVAFQFIEAVDIDNAAVHHMLLKQRTLCRTVVENVRAVISQTLCKVVLHI